MQFKVPQFLDIEDKIFGPFTFREFVYLAGGGGLCFVLYKLLGLFWSVIPIIAIGGLSAALVFYRPNNKPFMNMIEAGFNYLIQSKLYIWERRKNSAKTDDGASKVLATNKMTEGSYNTERLSGNKLRDLAWSLDVLDMKKNENTGN
jgi:hypothetical protein